MPVRTRSSTPKPVGEDSTVDAPASVGTPRRPSSRTRKSQQATVSSPSWGRASKEVGPITVAMVTLIFLFCPLMVIYFWMACDTYKCSLWEPISLLSKAGFTQRAFQQVIVQHLPSSSWVSTQIFVGWVVFQGLLYAFLPGKIGHGQLTPAGHILPYKINGLLAWVVTHVLYVYASFYAGWFKPTVIYDHWGALLICANVFGYFMTAFAYFKALYFPTHAEDRKFSGSFIYDMFMGVEFNPRLGQLWDFKLFHNGRPGILAWTLINLSFAAAQYEQIGYVTNSMILVNWLHFCYVIGIIYTTDSCFSG